MTRRKQNDRFTTALPGEVRVEAMHLKLPARDAESGRRLGEMISDRLYERLPTSAHGYFERLDVRIKTPPNASESSLADAVCDAVVKAFAGRQG